MYTLIADGDQLEMKYANGFLKSEFPTYEMFWQKYIVRLTNRPTDIHFKSNSDLLSINCGDSEVQVAQLHYSILVHLAGAWEIRQSSSIDRNQLGWAMFSLVSAQDISTELLARVLLKNKTYKAFRRKDSQTAREDWTNPKANPFPADIMKIRTYRNSMSHGHISPTETGAVLRFPSVGKECDYRNWRAVTQGKNNPADFEPGIDIINHSWNLTIRYLEDMWNNRLLSDPQIAQLVRLIKPTSSVSLSMNHLASGQHNSQSSANTLSAVQAPTSASKNIIIDD